MSCACHVQLEQHSSVCGELSAVCERLVEAQRRTQRDVTDDLDDFMRNVHAHTTDRHKTLTWKVTKALLFAGIGKLHYHENLKPLNRYTYMSGTVQTVFD